MISDKFLDYQFESLVKLPIMIQSRNSLVVFQSQKINVN